MEGERRYGEEEVRKIFGAATRQAAGEPPPASHEAGLTLRDLQEIGRDIGIEPAAVARAAAELDVGATKSPQRTSLGMPVQVGRIVPLPRPLSDLEWEQLVAALRSTFGARGRTSSQGGLREWVNGNLHACIEPGENGYRLRLGTTKGDAAALNVIGAAGVATGAFALVASMMTGGVFFRDDDRCIGASRHSSSTGCVCPGGHGSANNRWSSLLQRSDRSWQWTFHRVDAAPRVERGDEVARGAAPGQ
jgi:hypothetical protein